MPLGELATLPDQSQHYKNGLDAFPIATPRNMSVMPAKLTANV
ncbi:hypothetical protein imdm_2176 [gamma proteobacterium IMCC2047]|nr:hypothetical protein imdm_2176 [gamma proteobacterium IMCC2047]